MIRAFTVFLASALALTGCGAPEQAAVGRHTPPSPILYEITDGGGEAQGWLFGTMHALPDGIEWQTPKLDTVLESADILVVEVAGLTDTRAISQTFTRLASTPGQPDIRNRIAPKHLPALEELLEKGDLSSRDFAEMETWAAALMLAQAGSTGSASNGADRALLSKFPSHRVRELEGTQAQLTIFDALPPRDQQDLLERVLMEYRAIQSNPDRLREAWVSGDEHELEQISRSGIMADPELYDALLAGRNLDWLDAINSYLEEDSRPLIAVGAAHLVGQDGLVRLLQQRGYTLTRLQ